MSSSNAKEVAQQTLGLFLNGASLLVLLLFFGLPLATLCGLSNGIFSFYACVCLAAAIVLALFAVRLTLQQANSGLDRIALLLQLLLVAVFAGAAAILPVTARDALIHHLAVPAFWLKNGFPYDIPWHSWSYYPMLIQTVYAGLLPFGEAFCVVFHAVFLLLATQLSVLAYATFTDRRLPISFPGWCLLLLPVCASLSVTPLVDLALVFFCGAAIACSLLKSFDRSAATLLGIFLGAALSTKYNALLFAASLGTVLPFIVYSLTGSIKQTAKLILVTAMVALLVYSPWLLRNAIYMGNPLHPLFSSLFGVKSGGFSMGSVGPIEKRLYLYGESYLEILLLPIRMLLYGEEGNPRRFDGALSPLLLFVLVPVFGRGVPGTKILEKKNVLLLFTVAILFTLLALGFGPARVRYMAPLFVLLVLLSMRGIDGLLERYASLSKAIIVILLCFQFAWMLYLSTVPRYVSQAAAVLGGTLKKDDILSLHPEHALIEKINEISAANECTLLLYTSNAFYWYQDCVRSGGYHSVSGLIGAIKKAKNPRDIYNYLMQKRIDYLFVHTGRVTRAFETNLSREEVNLWKSFAKVALEPTFAANGYSFWRVRTAAEISGTEKG